MSSSDALILTIPLASLPETQAMAMWLAQWLPKGALVALNGDLGAGKTTLVQALAKALGIEERVTSPTFVLIHQYDGGQRVVQGKTDTISLIHADVYRLEDRADSLLDDLIELGSNAITVVEWAQLGDTLMAQADVVLSLTLFPDESRECQIEIRSKAAKSAFQPFVVVNNEGLTP